MGRESIQTDQCGAPSPGSSVKTRSPHAGRLLPVLVFLLITFFTPTTFGADHIYSYLTETGVKVITNLGTDRGTLKSLEAEVAGEVDPESRYRRLISEEASRYGIDETLVNAIIRVESNFDPLAVSVKNCKGLMQLHPDTAARFGVKNIFDPAQNIAGGVQFLSYLLQTFDKIDHVLAAYNAGENAVRRYSGIPPYRETIEYVERVKALYGDQESEEARAAAQARRSRRITRVVDPQGRVLLTNVPTDTR